MGSKVTARDPAWLAGSLAPSSVRIDALRRIVHDQDPVGFASVSDALRVWTPETGEMLPRYVFPVAYLLAPKTGARVAVVWGNRSLAHMLRLRQRQIPDLLDRVLIQEIDRVHISRLYDLLQTARSTLTPDPDVLPPLDYAWLDNVEGGGRKQLLRERGLGVRPLRSEDPEIEHQEWQAAIDRRTALSTDRIHGYWRGMADGSLPPDTWGTRARRRVRRERGEPSAHDIVREIAGGEAISKDAVSYVRHLFYPHRGPSFQLPGDRKRVLKRSVIERRLPFYRAYLEGGDRMRVLVPALGFAEVIRVHYPELYPLLLERRPDLLADPSASSADAAVREHEHGGGRSVREDGAVGDHGV